MNNLWQPFLDDKDFVQIDGGLATELETAGYDLDHDLWSAKLIIEDIAAIEKVHLDYLQHGADVIISATYQAPPIGFFKLGYSEKESHLLTLKGAEAALRAREAFWADETNQIARIKPLVAASIGPYGAYLADGSEYTGDYDVSKIPLLFSTHLHGEALAIKKLKQFHCARFQILAHAGIDLLAMETIPSFLETKALLSWLQEEPTMQAWFSFSCCDGQHISDGTPIIECAQLLDGEPQVAAIGVNCTPPRFIPSLIDELRSATAKPIIVYPNSGELWDAQAHCWLAGSAESVESYTKNAVEWHKRGATIIGGCCRTSPTHIAQMRAVLARAAGRSKAGSA